MKPITGEQEEFLDPPMSKSLGMKQPQPKPDCDHRSWKGLAVSGRHCLDCGELIEVIPD